MLERLSIKNVGGISRCELELGGGFTVVTGESGAGKSSIVRAIELVSGKRGQAALIRAGEEEAAVDAVFQTGLRLADLDDEQQPAEGLFFVKRALSRSGRGRSAIQGTQTPVALYASSMARLVHIQSQFAQMELLDVGRQLSMTDSCGGPELLASLRGLKEIFERARLKERELKEITSRRTEIERRYANAAEIVSLVQKVKPTAGLEASLGEEMDSLSRQLADRDKLIQCLDRLSGGMAGRGILDELAGVCETLRECLPPEGAGDCARLSREALQNLRDMDELAQGHVGSPAELSAALDALEQRLGSLRRLKRLAGAKSEEDLLAYCQGAAEGMAWLEESYERREKASREGRELRKEASRLALTIRGERKKAAGALEGRVNALFNDLAMDGIGFEIRFSELSKLRRDGADGVEFMLFSREGARWSGRVDKIASGGELSRLLLALQLSLSDEWLPPTLVFDEVEAGLGGRAAVLSGRKLQELSRRCQVILVTHEASIAALGDLHYVVRKEDGESRVQRVEGEERVWEIARMLSGSPDLSEAQEHARRLLQGGAG